jgi:hypothetical protein
MNLTINSDLRRFGFALLTLAALFASTGAGAVATTKITLSATAWSDLGVGPLMLGYGGHGNVVYAIGDVAPTIPLKEGFVFPTTGGSRCINTASHVWAMAAVPYPTWVYVAPIVGCQ